MNDSALPELHALLGTPEPPELGPGPRAGVQPEALLNQKLQAIFKKSKLPASNQELIRSLILLWHDHHGPAHTIAQEIENPDGSFVHGILHRREPDYWNAKYWFRRVGKHAAFPKLAASAEALVKANGPSSALRQVVRKGEWDPMAFVDACESAAQKGDGDAEVQVLRQLQKIETEGLLEFFCS